MFWSKIFLNLSFIALMATKLSAQNQVIDIWNGKIPNAITNPAIHQEIDTTGGWVKIKNVSNPLLKCIYLQKMNQMVRLHVSNG